MIDFAPIIDAFHRIDSVLDEIAAVKMPSFRTEEDPERLVGPRERIDKLELHLHTTAIARQEAHQAKLATQRTLDILEDEWADLEGWEMALPGGSRTRDTVREAKRQTAPDLYRLIQSGKRLVDRLSEQISRLERDGDVASRLYTFIAGA